MNALFIGATSGLIVVALNAFGANALDGALSDRAMEIFQTATDTILTENVSGTGF